MQRNMSLDDWLRIQHLQKAYRCPTGYSEVLVLYALTSTPEPRNSNVHIFLTFPFPFGLCRNGSNAKGYFTWSFLDVFELLDGFRTGYGLYYVDLDDPELRRYPKLSAMLYLRLLKVGSITSDSGSLRCESFSWVASLTIQVQLGIF
ncbi:hypothetical protein NL676_010158 [Syzygium grande]|nr:hypothetical protein NL676_010158 [Syzygium grande]